MGIPSPLVSQTPLPADEANAVVSGSFTATGSSKLFAPWGVFNVTFGGSGGPNGNWSATVQLERSFDAGVTWFVRTLPWGGQALFNIPNVDVSFAIGEPERGVIYRLRCAAYTSGTINYRLSASGQMAQSVSMSF